MRCSSPATWSSTVRSPWPRWTSSASWTPRARRSSRATPTSPSPTSTSRRRSRGWRRCPDSIREAAEWAHDQLSDDQIEWLRRLPVERRLRIDDTLFLGVHASPGSQTKGFDKALDATVILERASGTDARVICVGHTHVPEVRELGWKVIVNAGSAGYVFDGDPTASWALVTLDDAGELSAEIRRTPYDALTVANAISARGLPGDVYRAATVRTGKLVR